MSAYITIALIVAMAFSAGGFWADVADDKMINSAIAGFIVFGVLVCRLVGWAT